MADWPSYSPTRFRYIGLSRVAPALWRWVLLDWKGGALPRIRLAPSGRTTGPRARHWQTLNATAGSQAMNEAVNSALDMVAREAGVSVLFAAESGSRAWGFPSPDSDWDVRFIYAVPVRRQTQLYLERDTIERMLPGDLDLAGWELRKALALLLKGNCALREWLVSPIQYTPRTHLVDEIYAIASELPPDRAAYGHYISLIKEVSRKYLPRENERVNLKKYLYVVRPALALRWLSINKDAIMPMSLTDLMAEVPMSKPEAYAIATLLDAKRQASEIGEGDRISVLDQMVDKELQIAMLWFASVPRFVPPPAIIERCNELLWNAAKEGN